VTRWIPFILVFGAAIAPPAAAHEVRPAYLSLRQTSQDTFDVVWKVPARGEDLRFGLYLRMPAECENVTEPRGMFTGGAYVERWSLRHPEALVGSEIHIDGLKTTLTDVLVRVERLDGSTQVARLMPTNPSLRVEGVPSGWRAAMTYLGVGIKHILGGVDHLLFVLGLLFLVRDRWMLVKTITSFTVAHSITLAIATLGYATAPVGLLNVLIAMSILFLGPEIIRLCRGETSLTIRHPWVVAFAFGLLHGFGFASGLTELGLPQSDIPLALLMFNIGVEVGQLGFVAILIGMSASLGVLEFQWNETTKRAPGYVVGSLGAYWMIAQLAVLFSVQ
jgi:hypothetical protein